MEQSVIQTRKAEKKDMEQMLSIYNYEVENSTATFDLHPKTMEERMAWFNAHNTGNHPLIVAEVDRRVAGYASLSAYREKEAYAATVELSVYVDHEYRRRGVAARLLKDIIAMAKEDESIHTIVSVITAGNEASVKLHHEFGFTFCGEIKEVGAKFGKKLGIVNYQLFT